MPSTITEMKALTFFRLDGEALAQFAAEVKKLSPAEREELARLVAASQGLELAAK